MCVFVDLSCACSISSSKDVASRRLFTHLAPKSPKAFEMETLRLMMLEFVCGGRGGLVLPLGLGNRKLGVFVFVATRGYKPRSERVRPNRILERL